jgi:hypothetical protein
MRITQMAVGTKQDGIAAARSAESSTALWHFEIGRPQVMELLEASPD